MVLCLGFGVDAYHGVCHWHFLENVAMLAKQGVFLGVASLLAEMEEVAAYRQAVEFVCERTPARPTTTGPLVLKTAISPSIR